MNPGVETLYHFEKRMRQMGREHQQDNCIHQNIVDAVPLRRIYVSQTLFELVLQCNVTEQGFWNYTTSCIIHGFSNAKFLGVNKKMCGEAKILITSYFFTHPL